MPFNLFAPNVPANTTYDLTAPDISVPAPSSNPFFQGQGSQPTKEGALEYSTDFRRAAAKAYMATAGGTRKAEAGFWVGNNGQASPISVWLDAENNNAPGKQMQVAPNTMALFHTHPIYGTENPSPIDVRSAQRIRKTMYVTSRGGLYAVDPGGQVTHVFSDPSWMTSKNPQ